MEREPLPPTDECFEVEDLQGVIVAIREGRRPTHLDGCPRCRSLVESCREFLDPSDVPDGSNLTEASKRLALPAIMGWDDAPSATDIKPVASARRTRFPFDLRVLRPVLVAAAIVLVVWVAREVGREEGRQTPSRILRGDETTTKAKIELRTPTTAAGGGIVLQWLPREDETRYEAVFYREDLSIVRKVNAGPQTTLSLSAEDVSALRSGGVLLWQIVAMKGSAEIARSAPAQLEPGAAPGR